MRCSRLSQTAASIGNYFVTLEVADVCCTQENTFNNAEIDQGKIIYLICFAAQAEASTPQRCPSQQIGPARGSAP